MAKRSAQEMSLNPSVRAESESRTPKRRKIAPSSFAIADSVIGAIAREDHEASEQSSTTAVSETVHTLKKKSQGVKRKAKSATTNARKQKKAKRIETPTETTAPPRPKHVNQAIKYKVCQIKAHLASSDSTKTILTCSKDHEDNVLVDERALLGALCAMRADYAVSDPRFASVLDAEDAITERYYDRIHAYQIPMVVLNVSAPTPLERAIRQVLEDEGHSLEGVNLLKLELELFTKQLSTMGKDIHFSISDTLAFNGTGHEVADTSTKSCHNESGNVESKEDERLDVCPRAVKDL